MKLQEAWRTAATQAAKAWGVNAILLEAMARWESRQWAPNDVVRRRNPLGVTDDGGRLRRFARWEEGFNAVARRMGGDPEFRAARAALCNGVTRGAVEQLAAVYRPEMAERWAVGVYALYWCVLKERQSEKLLRGIRKHETETAGQGLDEGPEA